MERNEFEDAFFLSAVLIRMTPLHKVLLASSPMFCNQLVNGHSALTTKSPISLAEDFLALSTERSAARSSPPHTPPSALSQSKCCSSSALIYTSIYLNHQGDHLTFRRFKPFMHAPQHRYTRKRAVSF